MFPLVEIRQLNAVIVLAEELNFTKAAQRLHITQPALSKQITDLEAQYDLQLFLREKGRVLDLTDAGRAFVADARVAVFRAERAVHSARAASEGYDRVLIVGHSSHADQAWLSAILAIRLPSWPDACSSTFSRQFCSRRQCGLNPLAELPDVKNFNAKDRIESSTKFVT